MSCRAARNGRVCRRSESHRVHGPHASDCAIARELHHAFAPSRRAYAEANDDPMVRVSVYLRRSDVRYLSETYGYGGVAVEIRKLIAIRRGLKGARLMQHIGAGLEEQR